jgi:hypothetical protein
MNEFENILRKRPWPFRVRYWYLVHAVDDNFYQIRMQIQKSLVYFVSGTLTIHSSRST